MQKITEFHYAGQITNPRCLINKGGNNLRFDDKYGGYHHESRGRYNQHTNGKYSEVL